MVEGPLPPGGRTCLQGQALEDPPPAGTTDIVPAVEVIDRPTLRPNGPHVTIRFSAAEIATRVEEMAGRPRRQVMPADTLVVSVLKGSFVFAADLIRALSRAGADWSMDFLTPVELWQSARLSSGNVQIVRAIVDDVRGRDVLLIDDILESD